MGNLSFQVVPERTADGPRAIAQIQAVGGEFRGAAKTILENAIAEGARYAKAHAPRGNDFHRGSRIEDSITAEPVRYRPGGAGGGGYYEASISASSEIAPHLRFVFEGTGERGEDPHLIRPSQGNLHKVMAIEKDGEPVSFVRWTRGQSPQQLWWEDAEEHTDAVLAEGVRNIGPA